MNTQPIDVETVTDSKPQTQALAVRQEGGAVVAASSVLDMEPVQFKAGLDRRKANRASLMEWVRSALVEGTDFGKIPTKRGPSKPSLWKPGAEKICGMLGVLVTFPNLADYEKAALAGVKIENIILRCEITNSAGGIVASGVGARSLSQDYGDLNKCLKMAEKSAHIDATLRMAGLSEIFTQDLEDMKSPQNTPRATEPPSRPPSPPPPANAPSAPKSETKPPVSATNPAPRETKALKPATDATRAWMVQGLSDVKDLAREFFTKLSDPAPLLPGEPLEQLPLWAVPITQDELRALVTAVRAFGNGDRAGWPYKPHRDNPAEQQQPPGLKSAGKVAETVLSQAAARSKDPEWWRDVIIPIPRKGMKKVEYEKHPDTIGALYDIRHGSDDESQAARQRLWGLVNNFDPQPREFNGKTYQPSDADYRCRDALDAFAEYFKKNHPDEKL